MVQITGIAAQLFVNDVIESAEYYRDVLGFSFNRFFGDPPVFVGVDRGVATNCCSSRRSRPSQAR